MGSLGWHQSIAYSRGRVILSGLESSYGDGSDELLKAAGMALGPGYMVVKLGVPC